MSIFSVNPLQTVFSSSSSKMFFFKRYNIYQKKVTL